MNSSTLEKGNEKDSNQRESVIQISSSMEKKEGYGFVIALNSASLP